MNLIFKHFCSFIFLVLILNYIPTRNIHAQELKSSASDRDTLLSFARQYITDVRFCVLITIDSLGNAHARTIDPFQPDDNWVIWFGTNPQSRKVIEIRSNPKVTLFYTRNIGDGYLSIIGTASLVNEQSLKDSLWKDGWSVFYKDRKESYLLIKVVPEKLELLDYRHGIFGDTDTWAVPSISF